MSDSNKPRAMKTRGSIQRRLKKGLLLVGLLFLAWAGWRFLSVLRFERGLAWVKREAAAGRFRDSRQWLAGLPAAWSGDPEAAYWLGVCERAEGHFEPALAAWSRVPAEAPKGPWARLSCARTLITDLGRFAEAEAILDQLLERPGLVRAEARRTLVELYFWEGRNDAIRRLIQAGWRQALDRAGDLRTLWMMDGAPPRIEAIRDVVDRAAQSAPSDDRVWLARANLATQTGRFVEAARDLESCTRRRPDDPAVWRSRLAWARASGNLAEAERTLPHLPADQFSEAETIDLRAWLAARRGDLGAERRALEELIQCSPGATEALDRLAAIAWNSGERERAAELRRRKAGVDHVLDRYRAQLKGVVAEGSYAELASLAETLGRWFEAAGWWSLALHREPSNPAASDATARVNRFLAPRRLPSGRTIADVLPVPGPINAGHAAAMTLKEMADTAARPAFVDDAAAAKLRFVFDNGQSPERQLPETMSGGVGLLDYNRDGWLDVYLVQGGRFPPRGAAEFSVVNHQSSGLGSDGDRLFANRGDGTFDDVTERSGIARMAGGYGHGVAVGDYDNDGFPDLFVTRWRAYALYRNRGDGSFDDVTDRTGLGGDRDWPTSAAFADLDNDGDLDLYVCHYLRWDAAHPMLCGRAADARAPADKPRVNGYCMPNLFPALPDHLFRNDGGRFVDVAEQAGVADHDGRGLGIVAADFDDDGRVDLFIANDTTANFLYRNLGDFRFEEKGSSAGVACNAHGAYQAGMGVAAGDFAGDGRLDLAVTNFYGESTTFFRNLGHGLFADQTAAVGLAAPSRFLLGFGVAFLDANNDGRLDLITANGHVSDERPDFPYAMPAQLMIGDANGCLTEPAGAGVLPLRVPRVGRGLAAGDLDNDGRTDAVVVARNEPPAYFHNKTNGGHYVTFRLEGTVSNRDAVGSRVTVTAGDVRRTAQRIGGGSYQSAGDPRLAFGLGRNDRVDMVEVRWPSGRSDTYRGLHADSEYLLREGDAEPKPLAGHAGPSSRKSGGAHTR
jgi:enediyne biosynthesis protein E4